MTGEPSRRLSGEEILALKFAAHRQLAVGEQGEADSHQHGQRSALKGAVRVLQDEAFAHGCKLWGLDAEGEIDG